MKLFDTHCHLQDARFAASTNAVIESAHQAGLVHMVCCGTSEQDWPAVTALHSAYPFLIPAYGVHPWRIHERSPQWLQTLDNRLATMPAAGVGEIGLDHALTGTSPPSEDGASPPARDTIESEQYKVFVAQLHLAIHYARPASVHCRRAWAPLIQALETTGSLTHGLVIHSYSGSPDLIPRLAELGACFSFSGSITRSGNKRGKRSVAAVPLDRLLIETDAPDLPPVIDGTPDVTNTPSNLVHILKEVARIRDLSPDLVAELTFNNACRVFL